MPASVLGGGREVAGQQGEEGLQTFLASKAKLGGSCHRMGPVWGPNRSTPTPRNSRAGVSTFFEPANMGDEPRGFDREDEVIRSGARPCPPKHLGGLQESPKKVPVDLDGRNLARSEREFLLLGPGPRERRPCAQGG